MCFAGPYKAAYSLKEEHRIGKNKLLATIPLLKKEWKLSFEFKATSFSWSLRQVLHMTIGGKGLGSTAKYGDRTPAIWTHPRRGFLISSAVNGRYSYAKYFKSLPAKGKWINIEIGQELEDSEMTYYIIIGGKKEHSTVNSEPEEFENVKVFSSSPWYSPVSGSIRNLLIGNKDDGKSLFSCQGQLNR